MDFEKLYAVLDDVLKTTTDEAIKEKLVGIWADSYSELMEEYGSRPKETVKDIAAQFKSDLKYNKHKVGGVIPLGEQYAVTDGYRILIIDYAPKKIPICDNQKMKEVVQKLLENEKENNVFLEIPSIAKLRALRGAEEWEDAQLRNPGFLPKYKFTGSEKSPTVNLNFLLSMLYAIKDPVVKYDGNPYHAIYIVGENGKGF